LKTNATRALELQGIEHSVFTFEVGEEHKSAVDVARSLKINPDRLFKTLVCSDLDSLIFVYVIPGSCELDLKKAADPAGVKRLRLVPVSELQDITGYVRGGCSPIGMKKQYPTYVDESATLYERIVVSAGIRGAQLSLSPADLIRITSATTSDLT
jgi:Cys-tRNA(Pro)/Cys-tRNA(Cys) deacylase